MHKKDRPLARIHLDVRGEVPVIQMHSRSRRGSYYVSGQYHGDKGEKLGALVERALKDQGKGQPKT